MRLLFAACLSATLLVLIAVHGAQSRIWDFKMPDLGAVFKNIPAPLPLSLPVVPGKFGLTDLP